MSPKKINLNLYHFQFRSKSPCFADTKVYIEGLKLSSEEIELWIRDEKNIVVMTAKAKYK